MQVEMRIATSWGGQSLKPGDVVDVPDAVAARWRHRGIAAGSVDETGVERWEGVTVDALRELAAKAGVDVSGRRRRAELIEALEAADVAPPEQEPEPEPEEEEDENQAEALTQELLEAKSDEELLQLIDAGGLTFEGGREAAIEALLAAQTAVSTETDNDDDSKTDEPDQGTAGSE